MRKKPVEFDRLVESIESRYGHRPFLLRLRTALFVALGYAGFLFWFLLLGAIGSALFFAGVTLEFDGVVLLIAVGAVLLTIGILQAVELASIPSPPEKSRELTRTEAPILFECLDRVRKQTGAMALDRVEATCDFNAGVRDVPRLGFFGWPLHRLAVGLPLLEALSPAEAVAVLAHEMAHLSARHDSFGTWIYRLQRTWARLFEQLRHPPRSQTGRSIGALFRTAMNWYWPRLHAHLFVLSRSNELLADRASADCTSPAQVGSALWKIACVGLRVEQKFWPDVWQRATIEATAPDDILSELVVCLQQPPAPDDALRWCEQAAQRLTDCADTHPSFADRVRALGLLPQDFLERGFPARSAPNAADFLLGDGLLCIRSDLSALWRAEAQGNWQGRFSQATLLQRQLTALEPDARSSDAAPDLPSENPDLLWERAQKVLSLEGTQGAEPLLRQLVALRPTHSAANLILGKHLLDRLNSEGASHLQRILDLEDADLLPQACVALTEYFHAVGHADGAQRVRQRLERYQLEAQEARRERSQVKPSDSFRPHELTSVELSELTATLRAESNLDGAWLVQKELVYFPKQRLFVLAVRTPTKTWGRSNGTHDSQLVDRLIPKLKLPGRTLVISPSGPFHKLAKRVMSAGDSQIV